MFDFTNFNKNNSNNRYYYQHMDHGRCTKNHNASLKIEFNHKQMTRTMMCHHT